MNKTTLIGRVGKKPSIHTFDSGDKVAKFSLATSEKYKNKQGEKVDETTWHNIVTFNLAGIVESYVKKGDLLALEGKIKTRSYDKGGVTMYMTEIICDRMEMLTPKGEKQEEPKAQIPDTAMDNDPDPFGDAPMPDKNDLPS